MFYAAFLLVHSVFSFRYLLVTAMCGLASTRDVHCLSLRCDGGGIGGSWCDSSRNLPLNCVSAAETPLPGGGDINDPRLQLSAATGEPPKRGSGESDTQLAAAVSESNEPLPKGGEDEGDVAEISTLCLQRHPDVKKAADSIAATAVQGRGFTGKKVF